MTLFSLEASVSLINGHFVYCICFLFVEEIISHRTAAEKSFLFSDSIAEADDVSFFFFFFFLSVSFFVSKFFYLKLEFFRGGLVYLRILCKFSINLICSLSLVFSFSLSL